MECVNCGFENIPGTPACVRCQSVLNLGEVGVIPRRASALRLATRAHRAWYWLAARLPTLLGRLPRWRPVGYKPAAWPAVALTLVLPGLGHLQQGRRRSGLLLTGLWLAFLVAAVATVAGPWSIWWLMGAIGVHAAAFISLHADNRPFERVLQRLLFGMCVFLGLQWLVYVPLTRLIEQAVVPLHLTNFERGPVLSGGDGVLYEGPWLRPPAFARGEIVVYKVGPHYGHGVIMQEGFGVDRVIGLPGERVQFRDGVLLVNGAPPSVPVTPLGAWIIPTLDLALGPHDYAIIPSQLSVALPHGAPAPLPSEVFRLLTVVREDQILGRVLLRVRPWRQAGTIR